VRRRSRSISSLTRNHWLVLLSISCADVVGLKEGALQGPCHVDDDCAPRYGCYIDQCKTTCSADSDCGSGFRCLKASGTSLCSPAGPCTMCPGDAVCADTCRSRCVVDGECNGQQVCQLDLCYSTSPEHEPPASPMAGSSGGGGIPMSGGQGGGPTLVGGAAGSSAGDTPGGAAGESAGAAIGGTAGDIGGNGAAGNGGSTGAQGGDGTLGGATGESGAAGMPNAGEAGITVTQGTLGQPGDGCSVTAECGGQLTCLDGHCCTEAQCLDCEACTGPAGTCSPIPLGSVDMEPPDTCVGSSVCNGSGACKLDYGESCGGDSDCASNECAQSVCCANVCNDKCYVDTQTDHDNCGQCGHACSATRHCEQGQCRLTPMKLSSGLAGKPYRLGVGGGYAFWTVRDSTNQAHGMVWQLQIGNTPTPIATLQNEPTAITVNNGRVFWAESDYDAIHSQAVNGGDANVVKCGFVTFLQHFAVDAQYIYVAAGYLFRATYTDVGQMTQLTADSYGYANPTAMDEYSRLYAASPDGIVNISTTDGTPLSTVAQGAKPIEMAASQWFVYWSESDEVIRSAQLGVPNSVQSLATADDAVEEILATSGAVYWTTSTGVWEWVGGEPSNILPGDFGSRVVLDSGNLYWIALDDSSQYGLFRAPL